MDKYRFEPWVGKDYNNSKTKILILGESHYSSTGENLSSNFTQTLIKDYGEGKRRLRFFTNIMQAISGKKHFEINKMQFWDSVSFYNYYQILLLKDERHPTSEGMEESFPLLEKTFNNLSPTHVIICYKRLYNFLQDKLALNSDPKTLSLLSLKNNDCKVICLPNPPRIVMNEWHPFLSNFLQEDD